MNLLLIVAALSGLLNGGFSEERKVRISVLTLLQPRAVVLSCGGPVEFRVGDSASGPLVLHPGERLRIDAHGDEVGMMLLSPRGEAMRFSLTGRCRLSGSGEEGVPFEVKVVEPLEFRRRFSGDLEVSANDGILTLILEAPLEQVVAEIAAAEMGDGAAEDAMSAQAVAVRSYIAAKSGRHGREGFDFCDSTHCLLYRGLDGPFGPLGEETLRAGSRSAAATLGVVLADGDAVVPGYFNASCGGVTATPSMVWGGTARDDRFVPVECGLCSGSSNRQWRRSVSLAAILRAIGPQYESGRYGLEISYHTGYPYVAAVRISSPDDSLVLSPDRFRIMVGRALGWDVVRSNAFKFSREGDDAVFEGYGFGHGVGLCQDGARAAADRGWDWRRILKHYFPRCYLRSL